ncbi:hypothetical protein HW555_004202 [Spodoptera exigua]|uniref:Uncharacterized protein n=1 Tax=Spodoptera exigua TaxID=7107 RepID=A0A835GLM7_SPOEX|nr:hypothetical protein HW555_004202 [Spodoptera exigua]
MKALSELKRFLKTQTPILVAYASASERTYLSTVASVSVTHRTKMMFSNIVKCNQCNLVVSELLAFIQNKIDVMNEESLVKLCMSSFSSEEIESAKSLLFESQKKRWNGPVGLPHFSDAERNTAQSTAERCESLPRSTCVAEACAAAPGPRASTLAADCVPPLSEPALEHAPAPSIPSMTSNRQAPALVNECARIVTSIGNAPLLQSSPEQSPAMYRVECGTNVNTSLHDSFANVVETAKQWKVEKPNEQWVLVQKKRLKNRFSTLEGKARKSGSDKFKAADIQVPLFINNVAKSTLETDIVDYILEQTRVHVTLQKIKSRVQRQYSSYKMLVPSAKLSLFLDDTLWPEGITIPFHPATPCTAHGHTRPLPSTPPYRSGVGTFHALYYKYALYLDLEQPTWGSHF